MTATKLLFSVARITFGVVLLAPVALYFLQDRLLFFPQPLDEQIRTAVKKVHPAVEEIRIAAADDVTLHGWFLKNSTVAKVPVLIYFGGNAEEVSGLTLDSESLPGVAMLLVNYRGYGLSSGKPGEAALFSDAVTLYDYVSHRADVDASRIVLMGRSLGSGIAVFLASQRRVAAVVLVTPYDSITAVAQRKFPFMPVSWLLRHPFDSYSRAPGIKAPLLALVAKDDTLIPPEHARRLVANWGGTSRLVLLDGVDHDTISFHERYWPAITAFSRQQGTCCSHTLLAK